MDKNIIRNILINREGYNMARANVLARECLELSVELKPLLDAWLQDSNVKGDYKVDGWGLIDMMQKRKMHYLAAMLDIDWLIKEPEVAKPVLASFMK